MALIQFTRNHSDHSTDRGYQFEFFCDRCTVTRSARGSFRSCGRCEQRMRSGDSLEC